MTSATHASADDFAAPRPAPPRLSLPRIVEMNLGFFGLQFSFGLQQANMTPIYTFLGADEATMPPFVSQPACAAHRWGLSGVTLRRCSRAQILPGRSADMWPVSHQQGAWATAPDFRTMPVAWRGLSRITLAPMLLSLHSLRRVWGADNADADAAPRCVQPSRA